MPILLCGRDNITYDLGNGIYYECTGERLHSKAVIERNPSTDRILFIMSSLAFKEQLYGMSNFPVPGLSGTDPIKFSGSLQDVQTALPRLIGDYKVQRILFDEEPLIANFAKPGLSRLIRLVPYIDDGHQSLATITRSERAAADATRDSANRLPRTSPDRPAISTPTQSQSSGWATFFIGAIVILVIVAIFRSC